MPDFVNKFLEMAILAGLALIAACSRSPDMQIPPEAAEPPIAYQPETYVSHYTQTPVKIDGSMEETAWQLAAWTQRFVDIKGRQQPRPKLRTRVKMLWDSAAFYIFTRMEEPHVWGTIRKRDAVIFKDNDFEVFIDPNGDTHRYAELEVNALNTVWDLLLTRPYRDGGKPLTNWDMPSLETAVDINGTLNNPSDSDAYWTCEIALPWNDLQNVASGKLPPKEGQHWHVNFSRVQWNSVPKDGGYKKRTDSTGKPLPEMNRVWSPQGKINMHRPETWGLVQFTKNPPDKPVDFKMKQAHRVRWYLRNVYYRQKVFQKAHNRYASSMKSLKLKSLPNFNIIRNTKVFAGKSWFMTVAQTQKQKKWAIREDGKVWQLGD